MNSPKKIFRERQTISFQRIFETIPVKLPIEPTRRSVLDRHISEASLFLKKKTIIYINPDNSGIEPQCDPLKLWNKRLVVHRFSAGASIALQARTGAAW